MVKEIVFTCVYCKGLGYNVVNDERDDEGHATILETQPCLWCDGTGQVVHKSLEEGEEDAE